MVEVEISKNGITRTFLALIDSGADVVLMPDTIAIMLNIDSAGCPIRNVGGVAGNTKGFVTNVNLKVQYFSKSINIPVCFIRTDVPVLLGQEGFFENYKIKFEKENEAFEISHGNRFT